MLGMYPGDPGAPGSDCAGVIINAGSAASGLKPGDAVFGLAHGCLGTAVVAPAAMLAPMPATLSFQEAATTPTVFITVEMALGKASAVQPDDRVLVHATAGGVGLAAIQVAQVSVAQKRECLRCNAAPRLHAPSCFCSALPLHRAKAPL